MRTGLIAVLACLFSWPLAGWGAIVHDPGPGSGASVLTVGKAASDLKTLATDPNASPDAVKAGAAAFFDGIVRKETLGDSKFRFDNPFIPMEFKDPRSFTSNGDISDFDLLARKYAGFQEPPSLRLEFDDKKRLGRGIAGAYMYEVGADGSHRPIGKFLNAMMRGCGSILGDRLCAAVGVHENKHEIDDRHGRLLPEGVLEGEIPAFMDEYAYLKAALDPHELSFFLYNYGPARLTFNPSAASVPRFIMELTEHLGKVVFFGDRGDLHHLVESVYGQDPSPSRG